MTAARAMLISISLLIAAATIAAIKLPQPYPSIPVPVIAPQLAPTPQVIAPKTKDYTPGSSKDPGVNLSGLATATPGQVWISAGPGDDVCKAPGDCGYGDDGWRYMTSREAKQWTDPLGEKLTTKCLIKFGDTTLITCPDGYTQTS